MSRRALPGVFLCSVAGIVLWEVIARIYAGSFVFAGPLAVATYLVQHGGLITRAVIATASAATWGFVWGNIAAILMASVAFLLPRSQRVISAFALIVFCLPLVASGPILRVLYGTGDGPQITLAALAVYYTTYLALLVGLHAIPHSWSDLVHVYGKGRLTELFHIRARASLPYFIAGVQVAIPAAFLGAMIGEFTGAERGLGVLTLRAMRGLDVNATWAVATVAAGVVMIAYGIIGWLARRLIGYLPVLLLTPPHSNKPVRLWRQLLEIVVITIAAILVWHFLMEVFSLNRFFAKRPLDVWTYLTSTEGAMGTLYSALAETISLVIPGYFGGLVLGVGLAALLILIPRFATVALPISIALRSIPIITTAPLIVLALGRGASGTITIVAVMIFFPTLVTCLQGLRQAPAQIIDAVSYTHLTLPTILLV